MIYDFLDKKWLYSYKKNLELFKDDLELIIEDNFKIYVAVDFYDIFMYCFPFAETFNIGRRWENKKFRNLFYKNQISCSTMFFMLENIYQKPNILLPPYVEETEHFIELMNHKRDKYVYWELKDRLPKSREEYFDFINNFKGGKDYNELMDYLSKNCPYLIYYYSRGYANSIRVFFHLLSRYFTSDLTVLFNDKAIVKDGLFSILNDANRQNSDKYNEIRCLIENRRKSPEKYWQNTNDVDAIYSIFKLNEIYNTDKKAFIFISSAPFMRRIFNEKKENFCMNIRGKRIKVIRDSNFFLTAMIAIRNLLSYKIDKVDFNNLYLKELSTSIENDLAKLDHYFGYLDEAEREQKEKIEYYLSQEVGKQTKIINEIDFTILIDEYLKVQHYEVDNIDQKETAEAIIKAYENGTFINKLFEKEIELERMNIQYLISALKANDILPNITLYIYPLRMEIQDPVARELVNRITKESIKCKLEIKEKSMLSEETIKNIYNLFLELLGVADEIHNDEKLILWQIILWYSSRFDLVDHLYDIFSESVSNNVKKELSYLYITNFVNRTRSKEIKDIKIFEKMIKLCDAYGFKVEDKIIQSIELDLICKNKKTEILKKYISNLENIKKIRLNNNIYAFICNVGSINTIYLLYKMNDEMGIYYVDMRFIHLKSIIINEYISQFGSSSFNDIRNFKDEFENIFIPLVRQEYKDLEVAILADYAYFLSLIKDGPNHLKDLNRALAIMKSDDLNIGSSHGLSLGYYNDYILGHIYMEMLSHIDDKDQKNLLTENAMKHFKLSLNQLPESANYLRVVIGEKIRFCLEELKANRMN